jgi:hypothetical protein
VCEQLHIHGTVYHVFFKLKSRNSFMKVAQSYLSPVAVGANAGDIVLDCVRPCDSSVNSCPIWTKLHIWLSCDIISVKFDSQQFPRILMRCAVIWLVDAVNAITRSILNRFGQNFTYGLVVTLSRSSSTASNFRAY